MQVNWKWIKRVLILYICIVAANFIFVVAMQSSESLRKLERRAFHPAYFLFWQQGEFYINPPLFAAVMSDTQNVLADGEAADFDQVDIWVILLDGFRDIENFKYAEQFGIPEEEIMLMEAGTSRESESRSIQMGFHPLPFSFTQKKIVLLDAKFLAENYKRECLDEMVYGVLIGQRDQSLWDRCKFK